MTCGHCVRICLFRSAVVQLPDILRPLLTLPGAELGNDRSGTLTQPREPIAGPLRLFENREQTLTTSIGPICPAISALSSHAEGRLATGNADRSERVKNDLPFGTCEQQQGQQQPRLGSVQDAAVDQAAFQ